MLIDNKNVFLLPSGPLVCRVSFVVKGLVHPKMKIKKFFLVEIEGDKLFKDEGGWWEMC